MEIEKLQGISRNKDSEAMKVYKQIVEQENAKTDDSVFNVKLDEQPTGIVKAIEDLATKEAGLDNLFINYDFSRFYFSDLDPFAVKTNNDNIDFPSNISIDNRTRFEKFVDGTKEVYNNTTDAIADGMLFLKDKTVQGSKAVADGTTKAATAVKDTAVKGSKAVVEGTEKAATAVKDTAVKSGKAVKDTTVETYNNVKDATTNTFNNMNKGMKYSLLGIGTGGIIAGVSKLVSSFLKNKTAIKVLSGFGIFGAIAGIGSAIAYGIFATMNVNAAKKETKEHLDNCLKAEDEKIIALEEKSVAEDAKKTAEEERDNALAEKSQAEDAKKTAEEERDNALAEKTTAEGKQKDAEKLASETKKENEALKEENEGLKESNKTLKDLYDSAEETAKIFIDMNEQIVNFWQNAETAQKLAEEEARLAKEETELAKEAKEKAEAEVQTTKKQAEAEVKAAQEAQKNAETKAQAAKEAQKRAEQNRDNAVETMNQAIKAQEAADAQAAEQRNLANIKSLAALEVAKLDLRGYKPSQRQEIVSKITDNIKAGNEPLKDVFKEYKTPIK